MYIYCIYSTYVLQRSVCPLLIQLYTIQDKVVSPLTPMKSSVLNGSVVLNMCYICQKCNPGAK